MSNTTIAYPFTKSDRAKDKIMSEVMITTLNKILAGGDEYIKISSDELLIHGYYFKLTNPLQTTDKAYIFVPATGDFPELIQDDAHECLFLNPDMDSGDPTKFDQDFLDSIGLTYDGDDLVDSGGDQVDCYGGVVSSASDFQLPYYISQTSDDTKKNKIWIKQASDGQILGPWIYSGGWVALGAVYKSDIVNP